MSWESAEKAKAAVREHQRLSGAKRRGNCEVIMPDHKQKSNTPRCSAYRRANQSVAVKAP